MNRDDKVFVMGEEVARYNGAYKVTKGLLDKFGEDRVIDVSCARFFGDHQSNPRRPLSRSPASLVSPSALRSAACTPCASSVSLTEFRFRVPADMTVRVRDMTSPGTDPTVTWNFAMQAIDQIINSAGKLYYMSGGTVHCPVTFRGPNGAALGVAAQHSQVSDPELLFPP